MCTWTGKHKTFLLLRQPQKIPLWPLGLKCKVADWMHPPFPIIWYVLMTSGCCGQEGGWGPCCDVPVAWWLENTSAAAVPPQTALSTSSTCDLLLAGMFVLPSYLQGMRRVAMAGSTPPLQSSMLLGAPDGLSASSYLCFPPCPLKYTPGSHLCDSTDCLTAAAHDSSSSYPLALLSTPAFSLLPKRGAQLWHLCLHWAALVNSSEVWEAAQWEHR